MAPAHVAAVLSREWRSQPPATEQDVDALLAALPFYPPSDYVDLLRVTNGGEGELALAPMWFQLFDVRFAIHLWNDERQRKEFPNYYFFGSNGGLESIAMDMNRSDQWPIIAVDGVAGLESTVVIAKDFTEFLAQVGIRSSEGLYRTTPTPPEREA